MRIREVEIECFRSFGPDPALVRFPDEQHPIAIIGANNSGKTNLIAAILHATGLRSSYPSAFSDEDFFQADLSNQVDISVTIDPPLKSANAYSQITEMPRLRLRLFSDDGAIETKHDCCDENGKAIYNARAIKRKNSTVYTDEEKDVLTAYRRTGAERVHKWRSRIPVFYLGPETLGSDLRVNRYSLLGKVVDTFREEFLDPSSVMEQADGVVPDHVGKPRSDVYRRAMQYIEEHVIPTKGFRAFTDELEEVLREQLAIDDESFVYTRWLRRRD